jgi:hypothetical protein
MTRRDYCKVCSEMVADCDPMCNDCSESFCCSCIEGYDPISRIELLHCKCEVYCGYDIDDNELEQFIEDINSDILYDYVVEKCSMSEKTLKNMIENFTEAYGNPKKEEVAEEEVAEEDAYENITFGLGKPNRTFGEGKSNRTIDVNEFCTAISDSITGWVCMFTCEKCYYANTNCTEFILK